MNQFFKNLWSQSWDLLSPDSYYSWQVVIYLSLFSWAMSWLAWALEATEATLFLLSSLSWIFLAIGVGWALETFKVRLFGIPVAPWAVGAILCIFIFGTWPVSSISWMLISWPIVSFLVIALPQFVGWELDFHLPPPKVRQQLLLLFLLSLLLSSWFGFYFRIQKWFDDYPSLLAESFEESSFVYRVPVERPTLSEGVALLSLTEAVVQEDIDNRPWPAVERWLINLDDQVEQVRLEVRDRLQSPTAEHQFWEVDIRPVRQNDGYELQLLAVWHGPSATPEGYYQEKTCRLAPVERTPELRAADGGFVASAEPESTVWSSFDCELAIPRKPGNPPV